MYIVTSHVKSIYKILSNIFTKFELCIKQIICKKINYNLTASSTDSGSFLPIVSGSFNANKPAIMETTPNNIIGSC